MLNLLKILDNPLDDIKMVAVMRSPIGGFTDNEIVEIRLENRDIKVYENLLNFKQNEKVQSFVEKLEKWRQESEVLSLAELIWKIYRYWIFGLCGLASQWRIETSEFEDVV